MFLTLINSLPYEQQQILNSLNDEDRLQYLEQLINFKNPKNL